MVQSLFARGVVRVRGQTSSRSTIIHTGVFHGDPISEWLYDLFMDPLLELLNLIPRGIGSCFADDALLMGRAWSFLERLLAQCTQWALDNGMTWAPIKSCVLGDRASPPLSLAGALLPVKESAGYLGVSLSSRGVTAEKLAERANKARNALHHLRRVLPPTLSMQARRSVVYMFVYSLMDYLLYLTPVEGEKEGEVIRGISKLECSALSWILGVQISAQLLPRARLFSCMLSVDGRRSCHRLTALYKFHTALLRHSSKENSLLSAHWRTAWVGLSSTPLVAPLLPDVFRASGTPGSADVVDLCNQIFKEELIAPTARWSSCVPPPKWQTMKHVQSPAAVCRHFTPARRSFQLSRGAQHEATLWYSNRLPFRPVQDRARAPKFKALLEKEKLTPQDLDALSALLEWSSFHRQANKMTPRNREP